MTKAHAGVHVVEVLLLLFIIGVGAHYLGSLSLMASLAGVVIGAIHWLVRRRTTEQFTSSKK